MRVLEPVHGVAGVTLQARGGELQRLGVHPQHCATCGDREGRPVRAEGAGEVTDCSERGRPGGVDQSARVHVVHPDLPFLVDALHHYVQALPVWAEFEDRVLRDLDPEYGP